MKSTVLIFTKLAWRVKIILGLFFALTLCVNVIHRYHYRAALDFKISTFEWELFALTVAAFINPKGIKIVILATFTTLIFVATRSLLFFPLSGTPHGLILSDLFSIFDLDSTVLYLLHLVIYSGLSVLMFLKTDSQTENQLLDQHSHNHY